LASKNSLSVHGSQQISFQNIVFICGKTTKYGGTNWMYEIYINDIAQKLTIP